MTTETIGVLVAVFVAGLTLIGLLIDIFRRRKNRTRVTIRNELGHYNASSGSAPCLWLIAKNHSRHAVTIAEIGVTQALVDTPYSVAPLEGKLPEVIPSGEEENWAIPRYIFVHREGVPAGGFGLSSFRTWVLLDNNLRYSSKMESLQPEKLT